MSPVHLGRLLVEDLLHHVQLQEVVARAQGAQLGTAPLKGTLGQDPGVGPLKATLVLDAVQVSGFAQPL